MNQDISILPEDIVRIIAGLLDPHTVTLLDKRYRDEYFKKYGIGMKEISISIDNIDSPLLQKYKIHLYMGGNISYCRSEILYKNTVSINQIFIHDLENCLRNYVNLTYISGYLHITSKNLEKLGSIKNDLVLIAYSPTELELLKKYTELPNLIHITDTSYIYGCNLDGLENRIVKAPSFLLKENTEYPNIKEIKMTYSVLYYPGKNIRLPRIKKIVINYNISDIDRANIRKEYPGVIIEIVNF